VFSSWTSTTAGFDPERLQTQAQQVAAVARELAQGTSMADDALLAGLLHKIGYLVLMQECPHEIQQVVRLAGERGVPMHEVEREIIGASHAEVGAYLLGIWGLPYSVIEAVAFQHTPAQVRQTEFDLLAALATAETLALADTPDAFGVKSSNHAAVDGEYLRAVNAPFDWAEAQRRAAKACGELAI
jgi:HD-like signal output (HDOD) protein